MKFLIFYYGRGHHEEHFYEIIFETRRYRFTDNSYLELRQPLFRWRKTTYCNFGMRNMVCVYFEFGPVVQEMLFNDISHLGL